MPNKCDKCNKEFYSDAEFEQHQFMEGFLEIAKRNSEGTSKFIGQLISRTLEVEILMVQHREHCTIEAATERWFRDSRKIHNVWNRLLKEERDDALLSI